MFGLFPFILAILSSFCESRFAIYIAEFQSKTPAINIFILNVTAKNGQNGINVRFYKVFSL